MKLVMAKSQHPLHRWGGCPRRVHDAAVPAPLLCLQISRITVVWSLPMLSAISLMLRPLSRPSLIMTRSPSFRCAICNSSGMGACSFFPTALNTKRID